MHFQDDLFHKLECKIHGFVYMIRPQGGKAYLGVLDWACGLLYIHEGQEWVADRATGNLLPDCVLLPCFFLVIIATVLGQTGCVYMYKCVYGMSWRYS